MRHRVAHRKLGRVTEHRIALLRNQATALLRYEHLTTTVPKAKELRPFVERIITIAKRGLQAPAGKVKKSADANGRLLTARRLVMEDLQDRAIVSKLFETIAPRFAERPGGYTRLLRIGYRRGDSAEVAQVELVGSEFNPKAKTEPSGEQAAEGDKKKAGVGGRLRAAAERLRGKKGETEGGAKVSTKPAKGARKATTPRKAGGS
jgi:large subunit ribosomal protein L17